MSILSLCVYTVNRWQYALDRILIDISAKKYLHQPDLVETTK